MQFHRDLEIMPWCKEFEPNETYKEKKNDDQNKSVSR